MLKRTGSTVEYAQVDVRDADALKTTLARWRDQYGPPVGLIHGAGVIHDKLLCDKTPESFDKVIGTKLDGALTLAGLIEPDALKFAAFFSSVAGRFGNRGQADYAAANDVLNKLALWLDRRWEGRVVSMIWGPWSGVGMVSDLEGHLGRQGLGMITPGEGRARLGDELAFGLKGNVEVIVAGDLGNLVDPTEAESTVMSDSPNPRLRAASANRRGDGPTLDVAIVGMACRFPGARDLFAFWKNIVAGRDRTSDVPAERWDPKVFCDPSSTANDRVYCSRGGYLDEPIDFDPTRHGIMPIAVDGGEPEQFLVLDAARAALDDAGMGGGVAKGRRTEVVIGRGNYFNRGNLTRLQHGRVVAQTVAILRALHPDWTDADLDAVRDDLKASLPPFEAATIAGQITNATAGRIADRLDLSGPSYVVDAASASSLVAVDLGVARPGRAPGRPGDRRGRLSGPRRRLPARLQPPRRPLAAGRGAAVRRRGRRHGPRRGRRGRRPEAPGRRRARRRPGLRGDQGGGNRQRRPGRRSHLAECPRPCAGDPARLSAIGNRPGDRGLSKGTAWAFPPRIRPSCGPSECRLPPAGAGRRRSGRSRA